jgi:hypothetical protein
MIARLSKLGAALWKHETLVFSRWEMVVMRVLFSLVMFDAGSKLVVATRDGLASQKAPFTRLEVIPSVAPFSEQPRAHGLAKPLEKLGLKLNFLGQPGPARVVYTGFVAATVLYALGLALPLALGWMFFSLLLHGTFHNSQGSIHHHLQLLTCVVGAQWIASLIAVCRQGGARQWLALGQAAENRLVNWTQQVIVAGYVVSALSKLLISKGQWIWDTPRFGIQLAKAVDQDYYDHLRPGTSTPEWLPNWLLDHPWKARALFGPALPLEFFAFLALRNRSLGALYALALIAFHLTVSTLMSLDFRYNVQMMIVYLVNVPFWIWWWARGRRCATIN